MSEIIERVARAIAEKMIDGFENESQTEAEMRELSGYTGQDYVGAARAAIGAMREPTEAMLDAADGPWCDDDRPSLDREYRMMIDAALGKVEA